MAAYYVYSKDPFSTAPDSLYSSFKKKGMITRGKPVDSINETNLGSFPRKLRILYSLLRVLYRILGYKNYVLLLQFFRRISLFDMNTFLLGKDYENYQLR